MPLRRHLTAGRTLAAAAGLSLLLLTACSKGSLDPAAAGGDGTGDPAAAASSAAAAAAGQFTGLAAPSCSLVTPQELTKATGVTYTKVSAEGTGSLCNVDGASAADSFYFHVEGHIVVVVNADVNNPPTASSFTRTKKIEQLLISKL